ncbi:MAG: ATP-dependent DNA helicase, partial [Rhodospirillales bacterium]
MTALQPQLILPAHPAIAPGARQTAWLSPDGEIETITSIEASKRIRGDTLPVVCHAKMAARKLGCAEFAAFDVLELYAFVRPARFVLPTAKGLAQALGLALPGNIESEAECLLATAGALLAELAESGDPLALPIAQAMAISGWPWGEAVIAALGGGSTQTNKKPATGLRIIHRLPEWQERPPEAPPGNLPLKEKETLDRLSDLLGTKAEKRQEQKDYTRAIAAAFQPRGKKHEPRLVLAEAGTGVGKTLGYIAPASVWAEKNAAPVWISTYTRNLQRQLDGELDRLFPDAEEKAAKVVIRKGRENYFCLLNFEEALSRADTTLGNATTALGLMARWALRTRDGDMIGGDFPSWLKDLLGAGLTTDLTDTHGECIYSACNHYGRCFIEHSARRAKAADIVVANHALVMITAALGNGTGPEEGAPTRYIFDEGHHLFDAADGAFSAHLTGRETAELRRWLIGAEEGSRSRSRGLKARIADLIDADDKAKEALDEALKAVHALPAGSWSARLAGGQPQGVAEVFFAVVRGQVYARDGNGDTPYSLETETAPPVEGLSDAALALDKALSRLAKPLGRLIGALTAKLDTKADELDTATRNRIEAMARSLDRRGRMQVQAWRQMLDALSNDTPEDFVDWFAVERIDGREFDVGMHRHWVDPTRPFAETVMTPAQGVLITSATLRDCTGDHEADWLAAERRTGAFYVANPPDLTLEPSPFDYPAHTRVLVVGDVARG